MPVIIAFFVRQFIIIAVQLGIFVAIDKWITPLFNKAIAAIVEMFGVPEETAHDILANEIITTAESLGLTVALSKAKLPLALAEKLGFTSKGFAKRKLSTAIEAKVAGTSGSKIKTLEAAKVITTAETVGAIEAAKVSKTGFKIAYDLIIKTVGTTFLGFMVVGNWLDFGNWNNGAYQKSMQKFISWITFGAVVPDVDYRKSLTVSDEIFLKIYNTFKLGGAIGIQDPYKGFEVPFTRENLLDLTDKVGSTLLLTDGSASAKKVLTATLAMIIFNTTADVDKALAGSAVAPADARTTTTTAPTTKVFTGIVSQGIVGAGLAFEARPDDLIESVDELRIAATNNLAPFLATLTSKIVYEVKIVSSVTTKDGFTQRGTVQKIVTGYNKNGTPKYKTVVNKFATLVLYALTDKGTRAKLTTVVLGPVDSAKLIVVQNDITALEKQLPSLTTTTNLADIKGVVNSTSIPAVLAPVQTSVQPVAPASTLPLGFRSANRDGQEVFTANDGNLYNAQGQRLNTTTLTPIVAPQASAPAPATVPVVTPAPLPVKKPGASAVTLFEWYQAQGWTLPSVQIRSTLYQNLGLGQSSYYTGTSEQNTKLLVALKAQ